MTKFDPAFPGKRRAFGQHFLKDAGVIGEIAEAALSEARRTGARQLLEIGPGRGAITRPLLQGLARDPGAIQKFVVCERDRDLVRDWRSEFDARAKDRPDEPWGIELREGDFLTLPRADWVHASPIQVVSNLPYSSGTAILDRLARERETIPSMVLMFQAEVAKRLRAEIGTSEWGSLSIWIQNAWDVRKLRSVPPRAFAPPPRVDSEVVVLNRRETVRIAWERPEGGSEELWEKLLRTAFAHRRKMLRSGLPPGLFRNALELSGLDGTKRAEALHWDEWERFYVALITASSCRA